jgi:hypothetical protein
MKRLVTLAIMVAFLLGTVGMVKAAELTISGGDFRVHANYVTNPSFDDDLKEDKFNLYQRFRTNLNFVANENLRAVVQLQFNMGEKWGDDRAGYRGGAAQDVNFRQAYLQFMIPNTQAQIRAGWQYWALPSTLGSHIFDARATAIVVNNPINDMFGLTFGYARTHDRSDILFDNTRGDFVNSKDEVDHFVLIAPVTLDGFNVNPFFHYAHYGKYFGGPGFTDAAASVTGFDEIISAGTEKARNAYWFGINATMDLFDPIVVHADFNYGSISKPASNTKGAAGWIADLAVEYKMDMMTPMVFFLYESGESRTSLAADRRGKTMPRYAGDVNFSSFGFGGSNFGGTSGYRFDSEGADGKMAIGLKLQDISFMDKLTHDFLIAYYTGTNHKDYRDNFATGGMITTKDSVVEVNFDTSYQLYENLAAILELGYLNMNFKKGDDPVLGTFDRFPDDAWKAAAGVRYRF